MEYEELLVILASEVEVPVKIREKFPVEILFGSLGGFVKEGATIELPLRIADQVVEAGCGEIDFSKIYSITDLNKIRWREEKMDDLQPLEDGFYVKVKLLLKHLEKEALESENRASLRQARQVKGIAVDILRRRMYKIASLALSGASPSRSLMKNMTKEERVFYVRLCEIVRDWMESMIGYLEG